MCVHRLLKSSIVCGQIWAVVCVYLCTCWDVSNSAASVIFLILFNCEPTLFNQPTGFPLRRTVQLSSSTCWFSHHAAGFLGTVSRWIELESSCTAYWYKNFYYCFSFIKATMLYQVPDRLTSKDDFNKQWSIFQSSLNNSVIFRVMLSSKCNSCSSCLCISALQERSCAGNLQFSQCMSV